VRAAYVEFIVLLSFMHRGNIKFTASTNLPLTKTFVDQIHVHEFVIATSNQVEN